jgi:hypothetical protein
VFRTKVQITALAATIGLAGCGAPPARQPDGRTAPSDTGYLTPPSVAAVTRQGDALLIAGQAPPGAAVRLAAPGGSVNVAKADGHGRWSLSLAAGVEPRIFGLSMIADGRQVQAEGYVLTTPGGAAALLRAGAGAVRLDPQPTAKVGAIDFDRDGEAVISGTAPANAALSVQIDGRQTADARADGSGRYSVNLPQLSPGAHRFEVLGDGFDSAVTVQVSPPAPLADGPLRSQFIPNGLRADWLTPGGGVQSTLIAG